MKKPFLQILICVLAVPTCAILMGILPLDFGKLTWDAETIELLTPWVSIGAILGVAHLLLRPLLRLISAPIGCITLGLSGWLIDVALIYLAAWFVEEITLPGALYAVLTAVTINLISAVVGTR